MIDQQAEDRSGIAAAIAGAAEALTFAEIDELALPPLAGAVGARETLFWNRDPAGEARVRGGTLGWYLPTFIGSFEEHDPIAAAHRRFAGPTIRSARVVDYERFRHTELYASCYEPVDVAHIMTCRIAGDSYREAGMALVAVFRSPDEPTFGPAEERALLAVLPALGMAARRAARLEPLLRAQPAVEAMLETVNPRPCLLLDADGRLLWMSPRAERLLGAGPAGRPAVPDALVQAARRLAQPDAGTPGGHRAPPCALTIPGRDGQPLRTELYAGRSPAIGRFLVVELEDFTLPGPALSDLASRCGLTRAETAVLGALTLGLTNRGIADRLGVSVTTVNTHIARILRKLDVPSRAEAMQLARGRA